MRNTIRIGAAGVSAALAVALSGCAAQVDTASFEQRLERLPELNGALVEVQHPGLPTNTQVSVWAFTDALDVPSSAVAVRDIAKAIRDEPSVGRHSVLVSIVPGEPADYPTRGDAVRAAAPIMHVVAEQLGLPESDDEMLVLDRHAVGLLTGTVG
ncbi:hypothetical protein [Leucobacter ruminantium]|uniref:Uncharacterized protein n=1 Tax=Leucobacter ruminantium TaxID=1289170 RepID=A0A939LYM0_9MICO|nr:hypothetical protein [Leucobacter ruminantium]MBO1803865.1 hypothetical protein [Leucobacter ruminantium]